MKQSIKYLSFCMLMFACSINSQYHDLLSEWCMLDFDESMSLHKYPTALETTRQIFVISGQQLYDFFKNLYVEQCSTLPEIAQEPRIPKIYHIIWLGSPVPPELQWIMDTWKKHHQGWHYRIWTDEDLAIFPLHNRQGFDEAKNYAEKADIARVEILYQLGGVYADADTECLRRLDVLHYLFDFYIGIQPLDGGMLQLGTGVIGSVPRHPMLKQMILYMHENIKAHKKGATIKTGPVFCTKMFYNFAGKYGLRDVALPPTYFYPLDALKVEIDRELWLSQGAFTVHHWAKTWMPKGYRKLEFRSINNYESTENWKD